MLFLVQIIRNMDGAYDKGTSQYGDETEALTALYVAMASAMKKDTTKVITCLIVDELGNVVKKESWEAPEVED